MVQPEREEVEELLNSRTMFSGEKENHVDPYKSEFIRLSESSYVTPPIAGFADYATETDLILVDYEHAADHVDESELGVTAEMPVNYQSENITGSGLLAIRDLADIVDKLERKPGSVIISENGAELLNERLHVKKDPLRSGFYS